MGFDEYTSKLRMPAREVPVLYLESLRWVEEILRLGHPQSRSPFREGRNLVS